MMPTPSSIASDSAANAEDQSEHARGLLGGYQDVEKQELRSNCAYAILSFIVVILQHKHTFTEPCERLPTALDIH